MDTSEDLGKAAALLYLIPKAFKLFVFHLSLSVVICG
jgi:hypothetical protein